MRGQRLPDDRQRHVRRRSTAAELRQQLRQAEARGLEPRGEGLTSRRAISTFLNQLDLDLGSAGPVLLPGTPARIISGGKEGVLYLVDPTNMGKHSAPADGSGLPRTRTSSSRSGLRRDRRGEPDASRQHPRLAGVLAGPDVGAHLRLGREQPAEGVQVQPGTAAARSMPHDRVSIDRRTACPAACWRCRPTATARAPASCGPSCRSTAMPTGSAA